MLESVRDSDLRVRAAWLYYLRGKSQQEVGEALGLSRFQVNRLLSDARDAGIVRVSLVHELTEMLELADALKARWNLPEVIVAPLLEAGPGADADYARRAVGLVAAGLLQRACRSGQVKTVGVGWGRTVAAMAQAVQDLQDPDLTFVSLMGAVAQTSQTSALDVCTSLAGLTGGKALFLPAPFLADTPADCAVILRQRMVHETLEAARAADLAVISLGECAPDALLFRSGVLTPDETAHLHASGVVADTTGMFFRADGTLAASDLSARAPSVKLEDLRKTDVVLLAAGLSKRRALGAVLRAGFVSRLVLDQALAEALLAEDPGPNAAAAP
ncbi:MAG: sugar-binding transcriptional regulator [Roseinatronobacter sp.]